MSIQWFSKGDKAEFATIYPTNITINKAGASNMQDAYAALLGLDEEKKTVVIKPVSKDKYDGGFYDKDSLFILSGSKSYVRVSSTDFVNRISGLIKYDYSKGTKKYYCFYDKENEMLVIDLKKEVN